MTEADRPRRRPVRIEATFDTEKALNTTADAGWKEAFLDKLAETSNVTTAAEAAGVNAARAYRARREDPLFARDWHAALMEGYEHLELETLHRLRMGTAKDDPKFDIANALRILALHRETAARERSGTDSRDEEEVLAAIDAKLERIRARQDNATRILIDEGVSTPRLPGGDE